MKNLSSNEIRLLRDYTDSIYYMYENSAASRIDEKNKNKIQLTGNLEKDLNDNIFRHDNILKDTVIYPGIIGPMCKFKNFHQLIDYQSYHV